MRLPPIRALMLLVAMVMVVEPQGPPASAQPDERFFAETGSRIDNDAIWDYFRKRGGLRTFGPPIAPTSVLDGVPAQLFQRQMLRAAADGVRPVNLLDDGVIPKASAENAGVPAVSGELVRAAPVPGSPDYASKLMEFLRQSVPDAFDGEPVGFLTAYQGTVSADDAFPNGDAQPGLLLLFDVEIWGMPTSKPSRDAANPGKIRQRFQRGVMVWDAACRCRDAMPLGELAKQSLTSLTAAGPPEQPAAAAPPAPPSSGADRNPEELILRQGEVGVDGRLELTERGDEARGRWLRKRWERSRTTQAVNTGPTVADNTIWIARDAGAAHSIFVEEAARDDFPEAGDRREGSFPFKIDKLGDEISAMSACEKCAVREVNLHHRIVARKDSVVSVMYLFGRDSVLDQKMATWFVAQVLLRI